jgi:hypothetical protein
MSDQLVAEAATYATRNKHKRRTSRTSSSFEPEITALKQSQTYALDRAATEFGLWCTLPVSELNCDGQDSNMVVIELKFLINP